MLWFVLLCLFCVLTSSAFGAKTKPNLIVLMADDSALSMIGIYTRLNSTYNTVLKEFVSTPNIDSIGANGITFTQAAVENSICSPGRAAFLTGSFTNNHGVGCVSCGASLHPDAPIFSKQLQFSGYETAIIGKLHLETPPDSMFGYSAVIEGQGAYFSPKFFYYDNFLTGASELGVDGNSGDKYAGDDPSCIGNTGFGNCGYKSSTGTGSTSQYASHAYVDEFIDYMDNKRDKSKPFAVNLWFKAPHSDYDYDDEELNFFYKDTVFPLPENFWYHGYQGKFGGGFTSPASPTSNNLVDQNWAVGSFMLTSKADTTSLDTQSSSDGCSGGDADGYYGTYSDDKRSYMTSYRNKQAVDFGIDIPSKNGAEPCNALIKLRAYQHYVLKVIRCMKSLDKAIGRVLDYLKENKLEDNTVVAYTSDQGYFLGEYGATGKRTFFEPTMRTPFMIKWPNRIPKNTFSDIMIQNVDFAPTLMELIGQKMNGPIQGRSAAKVALGECTSWHTEVQLFTFNSDDPYTIAIRTMNYTYGKTWVFNNKYFGWNYEYYDNINDPFQTRNEAWGISLETATGDLKTKLDQAEATLQQKMVEIGMGKAEIPGLCPGINAFEGCQSTCSNSGSYAQCHSGSISYNGVSLGTCSGCRAKPRGLSYLTQQENGGTGLGCGPVHEQTCYNKIRQRREPNTIEYQYERGYKYLDETR